MLSGAETPKHRGLRQTLARIILGESFEVLQPNLMTSMESTRIFSRNATAPGP
jgi:hypothetical protein